MNLFASRWISKLNPPTSKRPSRAPRRRSRLTLETLETRRLLAGDILVKVSEDPNANGINEPDEDRLPGWTVYIDTNNNGSLNAGEPSLVTDGRGEALFTGLAEGFYNVREVVPPRWLPTTPSVINARVRDDRVENVSFLNFHQAFGDIQGTVWNDLGDDGVRAPTDPPLAGWTIFLDNNNDGLLTAGEPSRTTDAAGQYSFLNLAAGNYKVIQQLPLGWEPALGSDDSVSVNVTADSVNTVDFANVFTAAISISGDVWEDLDGNGNRSLDEPGLLGWTVYVDTNNDAALTAGEPSAITDAVGNYSLTGLTHGNYNIRQVLQTGFTPTDPVSGFYFQTLRNGDTISGIDFGNRARTDAVISGRVYKDADGDGVRDASEPGLAGITVYLDANDSGTLDLGEPSMVTLADQFFTPTVDETGTYSFTHLVHGTYHVREIVPPELSATPATESHKVVPLAPGEQRIDVDLGNVYRPSEIHGILFYDVNHNHVQDGGEIGIGGATVYIDANRNNAFDPGELSTVTGPDGAYHFTGLPPGAYVVRALLPPGYIHTYPETTGGILWPTGVSNPASGNVTPTSITTSLAQGDHYSQTVSLTLPGSGGVTNMVDVFLLFDDTGSFTANSPIVRAAFPQIIADLQAALPGLDLGFGVGRFEEYGNFASEYATGRPFTLNHAIVPASNPAMTTAIQAALDRVAPGYGGDQPETLIEALYQTVTGLGFDGNNNGSVLDSGPAGPANTQVNPGASGDVPSFASYTVDAASNVLPAVGNVGGAGFRPGALPVILAATDTGFAYQPKGETSITGLNGLTLPLSALTQTSRPTTPFNYGAGIQETITGLNALGALVIGLGTNAENTLDPRADLEAIAKLTGAVNNSTVSIPNGTANPVDPGDPFYFQISTGFAGTVSSGVVNAIQNAATNVAMNITVRASDPRVQIINHTGTINGVGAGQTATFDIEFVGDGRPHRFDLQFIREGTSVVLGSIPVVLGTPIPGDGYGYEELEDGEIEDDVDFGEDDDLMAVVNGAASAYRGENLTFSVGGTSAVIEPDHDITYAIDWDGNGTVDETVVGPLSGINLSHSYPASGLYTIGLTATEGGNVSPLKTHAVTVTDYVLRPSAADPTKTDLIYGGTPGVDAVFFFVGTGTSAVQMLTQFDNNAFVNRSATATGVTGGVIAYGYDGGDALVAEFVLSQKVQLFGGNGDDVLVGGFQADLLDGGVGNDILLGGTQGVDGADTLLGGTGADLLWGHRGGDSIDGGAGEDLLVADALNFGASLPSAVFAIQSEWLATARSRPERIANISGTGVGPRNNANYFLQSGATVLNDGAVDALLGGTELDWVMLRLAQDVFSDEQPGETKTGT